MRVHSAGLMYLTMCPLRMGLYRTMLSNKWMPKLYKGMEVKHHTTIEEGWSVCDV